MKFKTKLASVLLGTVALAGSAQAAIESAGVPGFNNAGGSELMLFVYDTVSNNTYTRDLGIGFNGISDTDSFTFGADAVLTSFIGSNSNLAWSVLAGDANGTGDTANVADFGKRLLATTGTGSSSINNLTVLSNAITKVGNLVTASNNIAPHNDGIVANNGSSSVLGTSQAAFITQSVNGSIGNSGSVVGNIGSTLDFILYGETGSLSTNPFTGGTSFTENGWAEALLGQFSLTGAGDLSFNGASAAVPVPAAVWLFGSALLGLVGVGRRKVTA